MTLCLSLACLVGAVRPPGRRFFEMMGLSHAIVGSTLYWCLIGLRASATAAPDLDNHKSFLGRRFLRFSWAAKQVIGHRGFSHSLAACAVVCLGLVIASCSYPAWIPYLAAFALGYASHVLADWYTREGVPLFWPKLRRYRCPLNIKTGGPGEFVFTLAAGSFLGF